MADKNDSPQDDKSVEEVPAAEKVESIRKFLGEDQAETTPEVKTETPPKEDIVEDEVEVEVDTKEDEALTQKAVDDEIVKAKQDVLGKIRESFGLTEEDEKDLVDEGIVAPWEEEKRAPSSWKEVAEYSAEVAEHKRKKEATEQAQTEEKKKEEQEKYAQQQNLALNKMWDGQLEDLRSTGKIPKISPEVANKIKAGEQLTDEDKQDPGVKAQTDLFTTMYTVSQENLKANKPVVNNIKEVYYEHYQGEKQQPAGSAAPIGGASAAISPETSDYSYSDIKGKTFEEIANEG